MLVIITIQNIGETLQTGVVLHTEEYQLTKDLLVDLIGIGVQALYFGGLLKLLVLLELVNY
jgi:hypothetical protein